MAAIAEAQARLTSSLRDIVNFFKIDVNVPETSTDVLNDYIERHLSAEFLLLAESYGHSMAFINHDELVRLLYTSWSLLLDGYTLERKFTMKRIRMLKEDKKADPNVLVKQELLLQDIEEKKTKVLVNTMRLRAMKLYPIEVFKEGSSFDYQGDYKRSINKKVQRKLAVGSSKDNLVHSSLFSTKDKRIKAK